MTTPDKDQFEATLKDEQSLIYMAAAANFGADLPLGVHTFDAHFARLLRAHHRAVREAVIAEIQYWFGVYLKDNEAWSDDFDMDFVRKRLEGLKAEDTDDKQ